MSTNETTPDVQGELAGRGAGEQVKRFIADVASRVRILAGETSADYVRVVGADLTQTAIYAHKGFVSIAAPADTSERWAKLTGAQVIKKKTHYLVVRPEQLSDPTARAHALDAAVAAVEHFREQYIGGPGGEGTGDEYRAVCPDHNYEFSVNGSCYGCEG